MKDEEIVEVPCRENNLSFLWQRIELFNLLNIKALKCLQWNKELQNLTVAQCKEGIATQHWSTEKTKILPADITVIGKPLYSNLSFEASPSSYTGNQTNNFFCNLPIWSWKLGHLNGPMTEQLQQKLQNQVLWQKSNLRYITVYRGEKVKPKSSPILKVKKECSRITRQNCYFNRYPEKKTFHQMQMKTTMRWNRFQI